MDSNKDFMTAKEVAVEFFYNEWSYQKVLRLTRNGMIPAVKMGKSYLYQRSQLKRWADVNFNSPAFAKIKIG